MSDSGNTAYVSYCPVCKFRHGWITCTDGTESEQFATVSKGMKVLAKLIHDGKVSRNASEEYVRMIATSGFELKNDELDEMLSAMEKEKIEFFDRIRRELKGEKREDVVSRFEGVPNQVPAKRILH
ncbi:MAG: hypothetical protein WCT41_02255 [Candidatus Paceibacterota bacterium]|jgi:uncharacterized tellurite resistance protein B-like protein